MKGLNFQFLNPYFTPDGVSRGFNLFLQEIDSPFNVSSFNTTSWGGSLSFSYPLSEIQVLGFDLGVTHTELSSGYGSVQEIESSPKLIDGINNYVIQPLNSNPFDGPVRDALLGDVSGLSDLQLQKPEDLGFVDRFGDEFNNFTITGNWFRNTLNRGQLANDGSLHQLNLEVTIPGSDLQYARLNYSSQMFWPLTDSRNWVIALSTNLGYGIGYGESKELPFFNNFFAGGLIRGGGSLRGYEENSLGPSSTAGARYLTETGISLARDENGNIIRNLDGTAKINNDFGYQTQTLVDEFGLPILDSDGNEQVQLAIQNFYLDRDYDSFGGNILATASLELLFPLPFVPNANQVRSAFFIDAGNVFSTSCTKRQTLLKNCSDFDLGELRYAAGISFTYLSPFGPLTFYVAAPFGDGPGDDTKTFDFTVGAF